MNPFEKFMALRYEPWVVALPASLDQCAVCGLQGVRTFDFQIHGPITSEDICPACGYEFGGNSFMEGLTFDEYRAAWIARGFPWWSEYQKPPSDWNPQQNLDDLARSVARAPYVPLRERAPRLYDYYVKSASVSADALPNDTERAELQRAIQLVGDAVVIGGGNNQIAYRFSHEPVSRNFLLLAPDLGDNLPRTPVQLNIDASGKPVAIENPSGERYIELTPEQFAQIVRGKRK
jgi:hypothetical protein